MNPPRLSILVRLNQKTSLAVLTAYELDVFTFLDDKSRNSKTVSKASNLNENAAERLLNALVALKLLEKENGKFRNTQDSLRFLSKNRPDYVSGFMHTNLTLANFQCSKLI